MKASVRTCVAKNGLWGIRQVGYDSANRLLSVSRLSPGTKAIMRHRLHGDERNLPRLILLGLTMMTLTAAGSARSAEPAAPDKVFVRDHCAGCHNADDKKGRLDLTALAFDPKDSATLAVWVKVHDRVAAGEMPPRKKPDAAARKGFLAGSTGTSTRPPCETCSASRGRRSPTGCPRTARPTASTRAARRSTCPT